MTLAEKAAYFPLNALNNARPYASVDPRASIRDFTPANLDDAWADVPRGASPSRALCDMFWRSLPWTAIQKELGGAHILDVGCGSGSYGPRMLRWADGGVATYTGTDIQPHQQWSELANGDARLRFYPSAAEQFRDTIPSGTNMFMSQSALEHFDEDLRFFDHVRSYVAQATHPVLQIHLVPSQACLWLYLWHGVRQYTPRTLSKIIQLFDADDHAVIYRLGGRECNRLHRDFITIPGLLKKGDLRRERADEYGRRLRAAIAADAARPQRSPAFYALIIHSHPATAVI